MARHMVWLRETRESKDKNTHCVLKVERKFSYSFGKNFYIDEEVHLTSIIKMKRKYQTLKQ